MSCVKDIILRWLIVQVSHITVGAEGGIRRDECCLVLRDTLPSASPAVFVPSGASVYRLVLPRAAEFVSFLLARKG